MDRDQLVRDLVRLRRAHRRHPADEDLAAVRADLELAAGPTVGRAASARSLGVSQTALDRWIAEGDVPVVLTPRGRREVPLTALLDLLDAVEAHRAERRPLAAALRARRANEVARRPATTRGRGHRAAELHGLAYHRAVAAQLDDATVADVRVRLQGWRDAGRIHPRYADEWERLLTGPRSQLAAILRADDEHAAALRQSSPFAGVLGEHERRALLGVAGDAAA
ncbi:MAG TPA: hypothetical protein VFF79_17375 [Conexibacter sp.]|jgi:hypothetical protein|nr:hypothetical protein [Conexibacter sp.]